MDFQELLKWLSKPADFSSMKVHRPHPSNGLKRRTWRGRVLTTLGAFLPALPLLFLANGLQGETLTWITSRRLWDSFYPHTRVAVPFGFFPSKPVEKIFQAEDHEIHLFARRFAQGNAVYVEVRHPNPVIPPREKISVSFAGREIPLTAFPWGFRGFVGISPEMHPGEKNFKIHLRNPSGSITKSFPVMVQKTQFPVSHTALNIQNYSNRTEVEDPASVALIQHGREKKKEVFSLLSPDYIKNRLSHPRDRHHITSAFYSKRVYEQYSIQHGKRVYGKPELSIHSGLDFRGKPGEAIYAMAAGKVVLAEKLFYEGNFTVIDHGNGIFTGYMHQSEFLVKEGEMVKAGQLIGKVGCTGAATGPHLHVLFYIRGVPLDPLSLLSLPVRD